MAREAKSYELKVKGLTVSDPNAYSQSEIEILASDILRRANVKDGEFSLMKDVEEALKKLKKLLILMVTLSIICTNSLKKRVELL